MKKFIISAVLFSMLLTFGVAQARYPESYTQNGFAPNAIGGAQDLVNKDFQAQLDKLQYENFELRNQLNALSQSGSGDSFLASRVAALEQRLAVVEEAMAGLNQWVRDVFRLFERIFRVKLL